MDRISVRNPPSFPEITITTASSIPSFRTDVGFVSDSKTTYKIGDFTADYAELTLPHVLKLRKGWGKNGENDPETAKKVAKAFVSEVSESNIPKIEKGWTNEQYSKRKESNNSIPFPSSRASPEKRPAPPKSQEPAFYQPKEDIVKINDKQYVQFLYWVTKHQGKGPWHGPPFFDVWTEHYLLFDISDGRMFGGILHDFDIPA